MTRLDELKKKYDALFGMQPHEKMIFLVSEKHTSFWRPHTSLAANFI